jgi:hypothetical protein
VALDASFNFKENEAESIDERQGEKEPLRKNEELQPIDEHKIVEMDGQDVTKFIENHITSQAKELNIEDGENISADQKLIEGENCESKTPGQKLQVEFSEDPVKADAEEEDPSEKDSEKMDPE